MRGAKRVRRCGRKRQQEIDNRKGDEDESIYKREGKAEAARRTESKMMRGYTHNST